MIKVFAIAAATIVAAFVTAAPLTAKDKSWPIGNDQYHVYYRDLDMNRSDDRAAMLARVERAANKLCAARHGTRVDVQACVAATVRNSMPANAMLRLAMAERMAAQFAQR